MKRIALSFRTRRTDFHNPDLTVHVILKAGNEGYINLFGRERKVLLICVIFPPKQSIESCFMKYTGKS